MAINVAADNNVSVLRPLVWAEKLGSRVLPGADGWNIEVDDSQSVSPPISISTIRASVVSSASAVTLRSKTVYGVPSFTMGGDPATSCGICSTAASPVCPESVISSYLEQVL